MGIKDVLSKLKPKRTEESEEFVEVEPLKEERTVRVRVETLRDFTDTSRIQDLVRGGNIVFLKIGELREKDINELKKSVDKLRKTCLAMNGDIVGVDEDFLVLTPEFAKIYRGKTA